MAEAEIYGDGFFDLQKGPSESLEATSPAATAEPVAGKVEGAPDKAASGDGNEATSAPPEKEQPKPARKRFVGAGRSTRTAQPDGVASIEDSTTLTAAPRPKAAPRLASSVPASILENAQLNEAIAVLPKNYNFEIHKSIHAIQMAGAKRVALQMPEGLLMYACTIVDILSGFAGVECVVLGDVTYGACCVDDYTAVAAGCDFLIHYGHSCLVPVSVTKIKALYVFVDIQIDLPHFVETMKLNFVDAKTGKGGRVVMVATIQFIASLQLAKPLLEPFFELLYVPQTRPLSPGELLGCTSPVLPSSINPDFVIYLGDGRFHLESMMIHNPDLAYYQYDPYGRTITREYYDHGAMKSLRLGAIEQAKKNGRSWGLILGTLGRQGNPNVYAHIKSQLDARQLPHTTILLSEISPAKLANFADIDVFVQTSCPRLSIDWGHQYPKPLLSPYEASVVLGSAEWKERYPMDYYSKESSGPWTPYWDPKRAEQEAERRAKREARSAERASLVQDS
ncbi:diphthamide biosynthesis protein [Hyaloraphidium curvatum]|nr:diphthamide biosynthesis protein [Hyaloraphidium curvatum]